MAQFAGMLYARGRHLDAAAMLRLDRSSLEASEDAWANELLGVIDATAP